MTVRTRRPYPRPKLIQLDAYAMLLAWGVALPLLGLAAAYPLTGWNPVGLLYALGACAAAAFFAHLSFALSRRCTCGKHPTIQWDRRTVHPEAASKSRVDGWARTVWSVARWRKFTCIHCGEHFEVGDP